MLVARVAGGGEVPPRVAAPLEQVVRDRLPVHRVVERPPHPDVVERLAGHVDGVEVDALVVAVTEVREVAHVGDERGRDVAARVPVDHAGLVEVGRGVEIVDGVPHDAVELDVRGVPVARVLHELEAVVLPPVVERERAVGDDVPRQGPAVPVLLDRPARDRQAGVELDEIEKVGGGLCQPDHQSAVVGGGDPHQVLVLDLALVEGVGVHDRGEQPCVASRGLGSQHPQPRPAEVAARHRGAVAPADARAHVEGVAEAVLADLPPVRLAGERLEGLRVLAGEPLEHDPVHPAVGLSHREPGVVDLGLGAEVEAEHVPRRGRDVPEVAGRGAGGGRGGARGRGAGERRAGCGKGQ